MIIGFMAVALSYFIWESRFSSSESVDSADVEQTMTSDEQSIAVLPFVNMSDDPGNEYFSDGISEELLNLLVKVDGLRVASRTSSFSFKENKEISIPEIAGQLNVDHVLEGSVRKAGNKVRVTAQLIDVRTDSHLWSETFDRELEDIFAIQDEIAGHIVQALKVALGTGEQGAMANVQNPTDNLEAYELYLQGRYFWQRRGEDNIRRAISLLGMATDLDPQFARAWSSLAAAHITLPAYSDEPGSEQNSLGEIAAHKALALDDSLAEALAVLGDIARVDRKWAVAKSYYLRAIASEPKNSTAHLWYGEHLATVGQLRDSLEEVLIAYQLDPLHPASNAHLAALYLSLKDTDKALKYARTAWDLGYNQGLIIQFEAFILLGEFEKALEAAKQFQDSVGGDLDLAELYVEAHRDASKRAFFLEALEENEAALRPDVLLTGYAEFDRLDDAYRVAKTWRPTSGNAFWAFWENGMKNFRQDPRFADLVTKIGLMEYWREYGWPDACKPVGDSLSCQ